MSLRPGEAPPAPSDARAVARDVATTLPDAGEPAALPSIVLHGVRVHAVTAAMTISHILDESDAGRGGVVVTPNLDHLYRAQHDPNFAAVVAEADLVVADGMPLIWASRVQGQRLPQRVAGSDLISTLTAASAGRGKRVFFLGGMPGTAERAAEVLRRASPELIVAGAYCPPVGFEDDDDEMRRMIASLVQGRPDVVYVALGSPKQEYLIDRIRGVMPKAWWLGVGVSFSFLCGDVRRAPRWLQVIGLEWTHRLVQEPRRLAKRYLLVGLPFGGRLMGRAALRRLRWWRESGTDRERSGLTGARRARRRALEHAAHAARAAEEALHGLTGGVAPPLPGDRRPFDLSQFAEPSDGLDLEDGGGANGHAIAPYPPAAHGGPRRHRPMGSTGAWGRLGAENQFDGADGAADGIPVEMPAGPATAGEPSAHPANHVALGGQNPLERLRAVVLLGGKVRPGAFDTRIGRSLLDLPLDGGGETILAQWLRHTRDLADRLGLKELPVRVTVSGHSPEPRAGVEAGVDFAVEKDSGEYRGTGGVLRDLAQKYDDDDLILVGNAAQVLLDPLAAVAVAMAHKRAGVALVAHRDGTPSGLMLVRVGALRLIQPVGFVDMKEQALPLIAKEFDVKVITARRPTGLPVRSTADYIAALRAYHRCGGREAVTSGRRCDVDPLAETWKHAFAIVEPGASVAPTARVHDSVILAGGSLEPGAVAVRSVVCAGETVKRDAQAVDQFVGGE